MPADRSDPGRLTVGSLLGLPLGATGAAEVITPDIPAGEVRPLAEALPIPPPGVQEARNWMIVDGEVVIRGAPAPFRPDAVEAATYNNPFGQNIERVWFDDKIVFALDVGRVDVDPAKVKVAQEYQIVYAVELDQEGKLKGEPENVADQYNIYDSVPGMDLYSPIWQFNYVVVPRGYVPNTLRSARACEASGFKVVRSQVFEN